MQRKRISVCVCTFRRYAHLSKLLSILEHQTIDASDFEVVVVDNTPDEERKPIDIGTSGFAIKVVHSSPPGLSRARNAGMANCNSDLIAFIDDDAEPGPEWLTSLVTGFACTAPMYCALGGPIQPIWSGDRPAWIPTSLESALTILNLGDAFRELEPSEYLFGTNIAFRLADLKQCGGFDETLGRRCGALLSGEETKIQELLRRRGKKIGYLPNAHVRHNVHDERLSQEWFRKRFAWQGVSDATSDEDRNLTYHWSQSELESLAKRNPSVKAAMDLFRERKGPNEFSEQLRAIRAFTTHALLFGREIPVPTDEPPKKMTCGVGKSNSPIEDASVVAQDWLRWQSVPMDLKAIFLDAKNSHGYLFELYGNLPGTTLIEFPANPWSHQPDQRAAIESFFEGIYLLASERRATVVLMTIDPFIFNDYSTFIASQIHRYNVPTFGFLHKIVFADQRKDEMLRLAGACRRVLTYVEDPSLPTRIGLSNLVTIHHHDVHGRVSKSMVERTLRKLDWINKRRLVLAFLGEFRHGKGLGFVLEAIRHLDVSVKGNVAFLFAGRGLEITAQQVAERCANAGVTAHVDIRHSTESYRVLTETEMDTFIALSDIVLLPYTEDQIDAMSGVMPSFIADGKPVLASEESHVGKLIQRHGLGEVFEFGNPNSLNHAISRMLEKGANSYAKTQAYDGYRKRISAAAVLLEIGNAIGVS